MPRPRLNPDEMLEPTLSAFVPASAVCPCGRACLVAELLTYGRCEVCHVAGLQVLDRVRRPRHYDEAPGAKKGVRRG